MKRFACHLGMVAGVVIGRTIESGATTAATAAVVLAAAFAVVWLLHVALRYWSPIEAMQPLRHLLSYCERNGQSHLL
jgi:hypothetical protein